MSRTAYAFGDDPAAARRLEAVAKVFAPTTDALLAAAVGLLAQATELHRSGVPRSGIPDLRTPERHRVLDLGCGTGHTTGQLAQHLPTAEVVGIDLSEAFLAEAEASAGERCRFEVGDVTGPLPGPAHLIYARYLLSHLPDVPARITGWCEALAPGGVLVLEEPEHISSEDSDFAAYEAATSARVAARGADMYAGPLIAAAPTPQGATRPLDRVVPIDISAGQAAAMFAGNLDSWGHERPDLAGLHERLRARTADPTTGLFDWRLRQTIFQRDRS